MKNLICPLSTDKIPEHLPRITAFISIAVIGLYLISKSAFILLYLAFDFFVRGYNFPQWSLIHRAANRIGRSFLLPSKLIDKAPKMFAARLGAIMFLVAFVCNIAGALYTSFYITSLVAILATLECVFSFCVGCYVYHYLILPFYKN